MLDDLSDLIARIEAASEGTWAFDELVYDAIGRPGDDDPQAFAALHGDCPPRYTRSTDAAESLVTDLPDIVIEAIIDRGNYARVNLTWGHEDDCTLRNCVHDVSAATYPLALVSAALRARSMT